jgi:hypothetical protein
LLAERGIAVSYETVRRWVNHFGPMIAAQLRKRRPKPHATWRLDEVDLKIDGRMAYLWRAVDAEGEVLDVLVQSKRNEHVAPKLMRKLLKKYAFVPERLVTDDLRSYGAAARPRHRSEFPQAEPYDRPRPTAKPPLGGSCSVQLRPVHVAHHAEQAARLGRRAPSHIGRIVFDKIREIRLSPRGLRRRPPDPVFPSFRGRVVECGAQCSGVPKRGRRGLRQRGWNSNIASDANHE